jgi:hypothetical protein
MPRRAAHNTNAEDRTLRRSTEVERALNHRHTHFTSKCLARAPVRRPRWFSPLTPPLLSNPFPGLDELHEEARSLRWPKRSEEPLGGVGSAFRSSSANRGTNFLPGVPTSLRHGLSTGSPDAERLVQPGEPELRSLSRAMGIRFHEHLESACFLVTPSVFPFVASVRRPPRKNPKLHSTFVPSPDPLLTKHYVSVCLAQAYRCAGRPRRICTLPPFGSLEPSFETEEGWFGTLPKQLVPSTSSTEVTRVSTCLSNPRWLSPNPTDESVRLP